MAKSPTKAEVYGNIASATGLSKKEIAAVFKALAAEIGKAIRSKGPFTIPPGLVNIVPFRRYLDKAYIEDQCFTETGERRYI